MAPSQKKEFAEFMRNSDIESSVRRCSEIFESGIFGNKTVRHPLFEPAVTFVVIHLSDLLQKANFDGRRVSFADDMVVSDSVSDVTELLRVCRNAVCHIPSGEHLIDIGKFSFCGVAGNHPEAFLMNETTYGCDFEDDIAVFFGGTRLYLRRHVMRALDEITEIYKHSFERQPPK